MSIQQPRVRSFNATQREAIIDAVLAMLSADGAALAESVESVSGMRIEDLTVGLGSTIVWVLHNQGINEPADTQILRPICEELPAYFRDPLYAPKPVHAEQVLGALLSSSEVSASDLNLDPLGQTMLLLTTLAGTTARLAVKRDRPVDATLRGTLESVTWE